MAVNLMRDLGFDEESHEVVEARREAREQSEAMAELTETERDFFDRLERMDISRRMRRAIDVTKREILTDRAVKTITRPITVQEPPAEGDWQIDQQEAGDDE